MATTTPNYGWDVPTSSDYVKDGALAIETLGDDIDSTLYTALGGNYPGLRLIKTQTIGSAVSTVSVTNAYSADYEAYKIIITGGVASTSNFLTIINTGSTANYSYSFIYAPYSTGVVTTDSASGGTNVPLAGSGNVSTLRMNIDVLNPFLAKHTQFLMPIASNFIGGFGGASHTLSTSYTGFTITPSTGTLTGGTIYVYGYGAS
jgi:hypothetical protein